MAFIQYNPNPLHKRDGDCTVRALAKALDQTWDETYLGIVLKGFEMKDMPSGNAVWGHYLRDKGFTRHAIPADAGIYTVADFASDHPQGTYILAMDGHVVCVADGNWYDSWNSEHELPVYYWCKES